MVLLQLRRGTGRPAGAHRARGRPCRTAPGDSLPGADVGRGLHSLTSPGCPPCAGPPATRRPHQHRLRPTTPRSPPRPGNRARRERETDYAMTLVGQLLWPEADRLDILTGVALANHSAGRHYGRWPSERGSGVGTVDGPRSCRIGRCVDAA